VRPAEAAADLRRTRVLALLAGLGGNAKSGVTAAEAKTFADQFVAPAVVVQLGWALPSELKEPDLNALRDRTDFQKLVAEVDKEGGEAGGGRPDASGEEVIGGEGEFYLGIAMRLRARA
jgi:hypothetical protein